MISAAIAPKLPPQGYPETIPLVANWVTLGDLLNGIAQQTLVNAQREAGPGIIVFTRETGYSLGYDSMEDLQISLWSPTWNLLADRMEGLLFDAWQKRGEMNFPFVYNDVARAIGIPPLLDAQKRAGPMNVPPPEPTSMPKDPPKPYVRLDRDGEGGNVVDGNIGEECIERVSTTVTAGPPTWNYHMTLRNNCETKVCFKYRVRFSGNKDAGQGPSGPLKWTDLCIEAGAEVIIEGEMPFYVVDTISLQIDPPGPYLGNEDLPTIHDVEDASPKTDALDDAAQYFAEKVGALVNLFARRTRGVTAIDALAYAGRANGIAYRVAAATLLPFYPTSVKRRKYDSGHDVGDILLNGRKTITEIERLESGAICYTIQNNGILLNTFEYRIRWYDEDSNIAQGANWKKVSVGGETTGEDGLPIKGTLVLCSDAISGEAHGFSFDAREAPAQ